MNRPFSQFLYIKFFQDHDIHQLFVFNKIFKSQFKSKGGKEKMDQFFNSEEQTYQSSNSYAPPETRHQQFLFEQNHHQTFNNPISTYQNNTFQSYQYQQTNQVQNNAQNDFNEFQEDQVTKRIRADEQRVQQLLKSKIDKEWAQKNKRRQEGRRALQQFLANKQQDKAQRVKDNLRKEAIYKQQIAKLNVEAGWKKVITNINVRQGERKGTKDINRMRQAILHRRQDDSR